jgi:hypothetical protein
MLIYNILGEGFNDRYENAEKEYKQQLNQKRWSFDKDGDAVLSRKEINQSVKGLIR